MVASKISGTYRNSYRKVYIYNKKEIIYMNKRQLKKVLEKEIDRDLEELGDDFKKMDKIIKEIRAFF